MEPCDITCFTYNFLKLQYFSRRHIHWAIVMRMIVHLAGERSQVVNLINLAMSIWPTLPPHCLSVHLEPLARRCLRTDQPRPLLMLMSVYSGNFPLLVYCVNLEMGVACSFPLDGYAHI